MTFHSFYSTLENLTPRKIIRRIAPWEQKLSYARDLKRLENVQLPILVDHLDGRIHRSYGTWPNAPVRHPQRWPAHLSAVTWQTIASCDSFLIFAGTT